MTGWQPNWAMPAGSGARWAEEYDRGRPTYPAEAIAAAAVPAEATVLDLGAGTGKLTRILATTFAAVVAVEPAGAMRGLLERAVPSVAAVAGSAEAIPLADASVDAVFAAEAFHHFDAPRAVAEIARVLRPRGALVLLWNVPAGPMEPPADELDALVAERGVSRERLGYDPLDLNSVKWERGEWREAFVGSPFEQLRAARFEHRQTLDRQQLVAFIGSMGWVGDLPDEERLPLLERIGSGLNAERYVRPWTTHVCWTQLRE
jgi:SAM-dependent methyltransferase